jgi:protein arginine kinase activator
MSSSHPSGYGHSDPHHPDRPLECSECKKPISTHYTEIVGEAISHTGMCSDCPVLQRRLFGTPSGLEGHQLDSATGVACGNCGTTLEAVRMGASLGCSTCYEVFEEALLQELRSMGKIPLRLAAIKKSQPLYMGRPAGQAQEISSSMRLLALSEALNETLKREDYEQAAWLRDQINALTDAREKEQRDEG